MFTCFGFVVGKDLFVRRRTVLVFRSGGVKFGIKRINISGFVMRGRHIGQLVKCKRYHSFFKICRPILKLC